MSSASPPPKAASQTRTRVVFAIKVIVALLLVVWLVRGGHLDMAALAILVERPWLLAMNLGLFLVGVTTTTLRFRVLLGLAHTTVPLRVLFRLQLTALFFNVVIPGNIGGDVVKALYVARDAGKEKRTTILLVVFVERLLGVCALVLMASIVTLLQPALWSQPLLRPLATAVVALGAAVLVGGTIALVVVRKLGAELDRFTSGPSAFKKLLNQLVASMRLLSAGPERLLVALGLSMAAHALSMGYFTVLTQALLQRDVPYSAVATIFPLGLLTLMIPISPSGLGVGHVAFARLFEAVGLTGGATVFNVYLLGQITPCLLGVFPFLSLKRSGDLPTATAAEDAKDATDAESGPPAR